MSGCQDFRSSLCQDVRTSVCQDVRMSGCQDIRISGYQDVRMLAGGLSSFISLLGQFAMAPQSGVGD